jgi:hypothetical protein
MTKDQREENARLQKAGRIPNETLSYLANVETKTHKKNSRRMVPMGSLIAATMLLSSNHVIPMQMARWLVGISGITFILFSLYFLCRDALITRNTNWKQRAITTT